MDAMMITHKDAVFNENAIYLFRKKFNVKNRAKAIINVSADARYKLWVNGRLAAVGPCKGSEREKYYDTVDISDFLTDGENEILAQVLQMTSCQYPDGHRFLLCGGSIRMPKLKRSLSAIKLGNAQRIMIFISRSRNTHFMQV